jgi:hypothetical protein
MARFLVERTFSKDVILPGPGQPLQARLDFIENNSLDGVTWVHSYIAVDSKKSYCVYDAPTPEAVRRAARRNGLPIDLIIEVNLLDPYFFS